MIHRETGRVSGGVALHADELFTGSSAVFRTPGAVGTAGETAFRGFFIHMAIAQLRVLELGLSNLIT